MSSTQSPSRPAGTPTPMTRQALQLAMRVLNLAEVYAKPHDMSQAHAQVARCLKAMDDHASAESFLGKALGWSALIPGVDAKVDLLCELAEVTVSLAELLPPSGEARAAALDRCRDHAHEATRLASHTTDPKWEVTVLLRISDVLGRCGDHDEAKQVQDRAFTLLGLEPDPSADGGPPADVLLAAAPSLLM